ncbi:MAG TPA: cytochrome c biogenesis protein ResB [Bacteriovoracaceae bacterium]|nr:cytochrome c biogenesis protein ResB [Bacteriovoracaceae bacterium]
MKTLTKYYRKVELFFGNMKFAVVIITIFAIYLGYGTFMESYHGTDYANRLVYKSVPFMLVQFGMFLSILFATLIRLPLRKNLYGFYVIHTGLILIFLGSWVTYQSGVDGSITLAPNLATRDVLINEDQLTIRFPSQGKEVSVNLPYVATPKNLDLEYEGIKLKTFYPFAEDKLTWLDMPEKDEAQSSSRYNLYTENFGEQITLTLHPFSDFTNTLTLGPLNVHYMPISLAPCFGKNTKDGLIVWNAELQKCVAPEKVQRTKGAGSERVIVDFDGERLSFLPSMSPLPLDQNMSLDERSPYRIFSKKLFEGKPNLFLFGTHLAYYNRDKLEWEDSAIAINEDVELPWMGFKIRLLEHRDDAYPSQTPHYLKPIQENGQVIRGQMKALEVQINDQTFWVKSNDPIAFNQNGERIVFDLGRKAVKLPYELILDQFKMDTDPGTNNPASYESFVSVFHGDKGQSKHHIYMNNPLKMDNFTFYQASYFQTQAGPFGSVLSVNFDPGRFWKYLGSLLLVLGSIWHYFLRRKHIKKPGDARA